MEGTEPLEKKRGAKNGVGHGGKVTDLELAVIRRPKQEKQDREVWAMLYRRVRTGNR